MALQSSAEDVTTDNAASTRTFRSLARPVNTLDLPPFQQERLELLENWRQQDERLYPGGFGSRRLSTDDLLNEAIPKTPVMITNLLNKTLYAVNTRAVRKAQTSAKANPARMPSPDAESGSESGFRIRMTSKI